MSEENLENKKANQTKKVKEKKEKNKKQKRYDKSQIFIKIMAGILAILMILSVAGTLIYYLV